MIAYLHGCQMIGFKRLTEVCRGLFGVTIRWHACQAPRHPGTFPPGLRRQAARPKDLIVALLDTMAPHTVLRPGFETPG
jgi:hypothetical protein